MLLFWNVSYNHTIQNLTTPLPHGENGNNARRCYNGALQRIHERMYNHIV